MATGIDVRENEGFEKGWFTTTVIAVIVMAVAVLAALTGALGGGPLAEAKAEIPGAAVQARYERFVRTQTPSRLDIAFTGDLGRAEADVHLDKAFLATRDIKDMLPRPDATRVDADGVTYVFALGPAHRGQVSVWLMPNTAGPAAGTIAVNGHGTAIHQFIFP